LKIINAQIDELEKQSWVREMMVSFCNSAIRRLR
jgi:hypothetical protein